MTQDHFDREPLALVLLKEGQQLKENFNHGGRQKPSALHPYEHWPAWACTPVLHRVFAPQHPQAASSPHSLDQDSIPIVLTMPFITGSFERQ